MALSRSQASAPRDSQYLPGDVQVISFLSPKFWGALWGARLGPSQFPQSQLVHRRAGPLSQQLRVRRGIQRSCTP